MNRFLAFVGALIMTAAAVSSACTAASADMIHFTLEPSRGGDLVHASFRKDAEGDHDNNWSTSFRASELVGLDLAAFRSAGTRPLHFALNREAGRLDCSGQGGGSYAGGNCSFTANPAFTALLQARGIGTPTTEQAFALMAVDANRQLIDSLATAHYPTPTINKLIPLAALHVDAAYIRGMAAAGYRPSDLEALVEFKALDITPEWIGQVARMGYANLPADDLVQMKALNITPEFVAGFDRIGYRHLPIDELVQLKALNVTPNFLQRVSAMNGGRADVSTAVRVKALGMDR